MEKLNDRRFCYFTAAVLVAPAWRLHTKFYKFGWDTFLNNARMNYRRFLIYLSYFISQLLDLRYCLGYRFYFWWRYTSVRADFAQVPVWCICVFNLAQDICTSVDLASYFFKKSAISVSKMEITLVFANFLVSSGYKVVRQQFSVKLITGRKACSWARVIALPGFWPRGQNPRRLPRSPRVYTYKDIEYLSKK